ncbi:MAG: helix-turn-helix transcriptional regulator [Eubacteriales bacterium]
MPFKQANIQEKITKKAATDADFNVAWKNSRNEYSLLHDITQKRKELQLTQKQLAEISNCTQQEISRLENREHSPALKTICRIVNSMGYELILKKKCN